MLGHKASQAMVLNAMGYEESGGRITLDENTDKICFSPPHDTLLPQKIRSFQKIARRLGGILLMSRYRSTSVHLLGGSVAASDPSNRVCNPSGQVFEPKYPKSVHPGKVVDIYSESKIGEKVDSVVIISETMRGHVGGMPWTAYLSMKMNSTCPKGSDESLTLLKGRVGGYVVFRAVDKNKLYIIDGDIDMCRVENRTPYAQYMNYRLVLASYSGSRYILEGKKTMNPYVLGFYGWKESTTLHVTFKTMSQSSSKEEMVDLKGELHLSFLDFLRSLISIKGIQRGKFMSLLLQSLMRTYIIQTPRGKGMDLSPPDINKTYYPPSVLHELKTDDGVIISCRQWKCDQILGETKQNPVLLINGYFGESYCLPTEPKDLVRTLVENGHETLLLQSRLHPIHPSNGFTIQDIGKFDIPAVIKKIHELHRSSIKVHVVAHCAGGLAIHIALMGGHVSATNIAS
ncbi:hypothetical protein GIB67_012754 [Kingdonia uniflora]|uniref:Uncharacterized protein n=1 Tax=Kingdonia uniflora TaxID=39325 RepID=A0A7J7NFC4_9MAGN|nr:hypothetical protein GIB67_012754 [Kingdonia uniflora]